ncbi:hypothetical protein OG552_29565 [Streptomyces sp. NBC_01476]|nr:hypothetical protein [Streptomyces sp. NBC_01476]
MENTPQTTGSDLLLAKGKVAAARARTAIPSDNTGGKSDQNDT